MKKSKRNYTHRSLNDWKTILTIYQDSGLTQEAFCQQNKLSASTFSKWKKQLSLPSIPCSSDFIEIQPEPPLPTKTLADGIARIELSINLSRRFQLNLKIA